MKTDKPFCGDCEYLTALQEYETRRCKKYGAVIYPCSEMPQQFHRNHNCKRDHPERGETRHNPKPKKPEYIERYFLRVHMNVPIGEIQTTEYLTYEDMKNAAMDEYHKSKSSVSHMYGETLRELKK